VAGGPTTDTGGSSYLIHVRHAAMAIEAGHCNVALVTLAGRPRSLELDPDFDLFRRLHRGEAPAAISQLMGADSLTVILAAGSPAPLRDAYRQAAETMSASIPTGVRDDGSLALADLRAGSTWVLGESSWSARLRELLPRDVGIDAQSFTVGGQGYDRAGHTLVLALPHPSVRDEALGWMLAADPASAIAVGKKLTHYGKYGYLVFAGAENVAKGVWEVERSPLKIVWEEEK
jgi:hypothetical protein